MRDFHFSISARMLYNNSSNTFFTLSRLVATHGKSLTFRIEPQRDTHIFRRPGFRDDLVCWRQPRTGWGRRRGKFQEYSSLRGTFRGVNIHHHHKAQHPSDRISHMKSNRRCPGVPKRYKIKSLSTVIRAKVHCHRRLIFNFFRFRRYLALGFHHVNFTDRADELSLAR